MVKLRKTKITFNYHPVLPYVLNFIRCYSFPEITGITMAERKKIKEIMIKSFKNGHSIKELTKEIQHIIGDYDKAFAIAQTETVRIANKARLEWYEDQGVEKVRWESPGGKKLCPICKPNVGNKYKLGKQPELPYHVNCRCVWGRTSL